MISPTPLDLVTLANTEDWIFGMNASATKDGQTLQTLISALSLDFLRRTGRGAQNGSIPAASPFVQAVSYAETYTGNGNDEIMLRNWPIISVQSVSIFGQPLQQSTAANVPGWFISADGKFLGLRGSTGADIRAAWGGLGYGRGNCARGGWPKATDCISVAYTAGFAAQPITNERQTIPAQPAAWAQGTYSSGQVVFDGTNVQQCQITNNTMQVAQTGSATPAWNQVIGGTTADGALLVWTNLGPPFMLTVNQLPWVADSGVSFFVGGTSLQAVQTAPSAGQYFAQGNGSYLFNSADAGKAVLISYSTAGTPYDIQEAMYRWVNLIYKRRGWEGIRSLMQKDAGSTIYTSFEVDPSVQRVIEYYKRRR